MMNNTNKIRPLKRADFVWCRKPGSNRYGYFYPWDFKSQASTYFAIPAYHIILAQTYFFVKGFYQVFKKKAA